MKRVGLAITALLLIVAAAACHGTEPGTKHWRKGSGLNAKTLVSVYVPPTNPIDPTIDNDAPEILAMVDNFVNQLDATVQPGVFTPADVALKRVTTPCGGDNFNNDIPNCFYVWTVPNQYLSDSYGAGVAGAALIWQDDMHLYNGPGVSQPDRPSRIEVAIDWTGQPALARTNAYCHEGLHMLNLHHPTHGEPGPCDGNGVMDADDFSALDTTVDACHLDLPGPAPAPAPVVQYGNATDGPCGGASAAAFSAHSYGAPTLEVLSADKFDEFKE